MLKDRLYYADPYCKSFTAQIIKAAQDAEGNHYVVLDNTAFYPTGGGQPYDTGTLNGIAYSMWRKWMMKFAIYWLKVWFCDLKWKALSTGSDALIICNSMQGNIFCQLRLLNCSGFRR